MPDSSAADRVAAGSPERFGYSWHQYGGVLPEHEAQFLRWTDSNPEFWRGLRFLDAGCGIGRNSFWPMSYGAQACLAIDADERTLARARENLARYPMAEIRQESIYDLAAVDAFDVAFSIGVIHHLSDPDAAVARLVQATKPGGQVLVWLYGRENNGWIVHLFDPLRRALFSRLPLRFVHALSWPLTWMLRFLVYCGVFSGTYYRAIRGYTFDHLRAIVFDHMIPKIALYYRREEAEDLARRAGLVEIETVWVNENSWLVRGRKPGAA